jgi:hypothetical protein
MCVLTAHTHRHAINDKAAADGTMLSLTALFSYSIEWHAAATPQHILDNMKHQLCRKNKDARLRQPEHHANQLQTQKNPAQPFVFAEPARPSIPPFNRLNIPRSV